MVISPYILYTGSCFKYMWEKQCNMLKPDNKNPWMRVEKAACILERGRILVYTDTYRSDKAEAL